MQQLNHSINKKKIQRHISTSTLSYSGGSIHCVAEGFCTGGIWSFAAPYRERGMFSNNPIFPTITLYVSYMYRLNESTAFLNACFQVAHSWGK